MLRHKGYRRKFALFPPLAKQPSHRGFLKECLEVFLKKRELGQRKHQMLPVTRIDQRSPPLYCRFTTGFNEPDGFQVKLISMQRGHDLRSKPRMDSRDIPFAPLCSRYFLQAVRENSPVTEDIHGNKDVISNNCNEQYRRRHKAISATTGNLWFYRKQSP